MYPDARKLICMLRTHPEIWLVWCANVYVMLTAHIGCDGEHNDWHASGCPAEYTINSVEYLHGLLLATVHVAAVVRPMQHADNNNKIDIRIVAIEIK